MNFKQKTLFQTLEENIKVKNFEKADIAASLLFDEKSFSKNAIFRLKKSLYKLATIFSAQRQYVNSIKHFEFARSITSQDSKLVNREFKVIKEIFSSYKDEFIEEDLLVFSAILSLAIEPYKKRKINFFTPAIKIEVDLRRKIKQLLPNVPKKAESKVSYKLEQILNSLNPDLTEDERIKKAAEILTPAIIEIYKKKLRKNKDKKSK